MNKIAEKLPKTAILHFDDYSFKGAVDDFYKWLIDGADYNIWDLSPLEKDIVSVGKSGSYNYLLLDYPLAYCHNLIKNHIDYAVFIDTSLDIAMARKVLREYKNASAEEIRNDMEMYLKYARGA